MKRAALERRRTVRQWLKRNPLNEGLAVGRFRKGRRPQGCPRPRAACLWKKRSPTRQDLQSRLDLFEQRAETDTA